MMVTITDVLDSAIGQNLHLISAEPCKRPIGLDLGQRLKAKRLESQDVSVTSENKHNVQNLLL